MFNTIKKFIVFFFIKILFKRNVQNYIFNKKIIIFSFDVQAFCTIRRMDTKANKKFIDF